MLARIALAAAAALVVAGIGRGQWAATEEAKLTASGAADFDELGFAVAFDGDTALVGAPVDDHGSGPFDQVNGLAFDPLTKTLFGCDGPTDGLIGIDMGSGAGSPIGTIGSSGVFGLAFDPGTSILYASDFGPVGFSKLFTIDVATGVGTYVGDIGFLVVELAFDPGTNTLYGLAGSYQGSHLIAIDAATGQGSLIGFLGLDSAAGLDFDPGTSTLYGTEVWSDQLITIDTTTGVASTVGPLGFDWVSGLAFDPGTSTLYGTDIGSDQLITIDTATGAGAAVGKLSGGPAVFAGSVHAYVRSGANWIEQAQLTASGPSSYDYFGLSVAIDGDTALVGAPAYDPFFSYYYTPGATPGPGAVHVFVRNGTSWSEQAKLTASDGAASDRFGYSVAIDGDTAVIGAPGADHVGGSNEGAAYVFTRSGTIWIEQAKLTDAGGEVGDGLGWSVAISGGAAAIGVPFRNGGAYSHFSSAGAVYVFVGGGSTWNQKAQLFSNKPWHGDHLGWSVSISGDTIVAGAPQDNLMPGVDDAGSVTVFVRSGQGWSEQARLLASNGAEYELLGSTVALQGDWVVAGAPGNSYGPVVTPGSAYLFVRSGTAWSQMPELLASDGANGDRFGTSVALSGDAAVIGRPYDDHAGGVDAGSAYVFRLSPSSPVSYCTAGVSYSGCQATLSGTGTPSASASTGFLLQATGVEGHTAGMFLFGANGRQANPWGNGTSFQCLAPPVTGAGLLSGLGTKGFCDGSFSQDLNALWCPTCPKPQANPGAGATVQAQLWYRDPLSTSNQTTNLSEAIEFAVGH